MTYVVVQIYPIGPQNSNIQAMDEEVQGDITNLISQFSTQCTQGKMK